MPESQMPHRAQPVGRRPTSPRSVIEPIGCAAPGRIYDRGVATAAVPLGARARRRRRRRRLSSLDIRSAMAVDRIRRARAMSDRLRCIAETPAARSTRSSSSAVDLDRHGAGWERERDGGAGGSTAGRSTCGVRRARVTLGRLPGLPRLPPTLHERSSRALCPYRPPDQARHVRRVHRRLPRRRRPARRLGPLPRPAQPRRRERGRDLRVLRRDARGARAQPGRVRVPDASASGSRRSSRKWSSTASTTSSSRAPPDRRSRAETIPSGAPALACAPPRRYGHGCGARRQHAARAPARRRRAGLRGAGRPARRRPAARRSHLPAHGRRGRRRGAGDLARRGARARRASRAARRCGRGSSASSSTAPGRAPSATPGACRSRPSRPTASPPWSRRPSPPTELDERAAAARRRSRDGPARRRAARAAPRGRRHAARDQRAVITLRDLVGLSAAETCELLEITDGNQRVLLHRARARVRTALRPIVEAPRMMRLLTPPPRPRRPRPADVPGVRRARHGLPRGHAPARRARADGRAPRRLRRLLGLPRGHAPARRHAARDARAAARRRRRARRCCARSATSAATRATAHDGRARLGVS